MQMLFRDSRFFAGRGTSGATSMTTGASTLGRMGSIVTGYRSKAAIWPYAVAAPFSLPSPFMRIRPVHCFALAFLLAPGALLAQGQRPPTVVELATAQTRPALDTVQLTGSLRANEQVAITPELPGRIRQVHAEEGQAVAAGALLFTLDPALLGAERDEREAAFQLAERNFQRAKELLAKKLIAQSDYDQAKSNLEVSRAALQSIRVRLGKLEIRAPFAGIMGLREVSVGEYVEAGRRLTRLAQLDPIKLDVLVPERNLPSLRPGLPITAQIDALGGARFSGELVAIDPVVDSVSRTVAVRARLPNPQRQLKPGMFARVAIELQRREQAIWIPEQALVPEPGGTYVYRVVDGNAERVEVSTGMRSPGEVEVTSGLSSGDVVVSAGQMKISAGSAVRAADSGGAP